MRITAIKEEDFVNYKKPAMFLGTTKCSWKCCTEQNLPISTCQNSSLCNANYSEFNDSFLVERYMNNPITKAVVIGGLEPFDTFDDLYRFISNFREQTQDDVVIYTGYYPEEIAEKVEKLKQYSNIIIKFGRYKPNQEKHYDEVLGVYLASNNQYGVRIS